MTAGFEAERIEMQNTLNERDQRNLEVENQLVDARAEIDRAAEANNSLQVPTYPLDHISLPPTVYRLSKIILTLF